MARISQKAFTLIELLVVVAIMTLISATLFANNRGFGGSVQLQNLAYDVALSMRQSQIYGISVARYQSNNFGVGYGMHYAMSSPSLYVLFGDGNSNGLYDNGATPTELVSSSNITGGFKILKLCATPSSGIEDCTITSLDIEFKRPEPDAYISANNNSCIATSGNCQRGARIWLTSPRGDTMSVSVSASGQISVDQKVNIAK